MTANLAARITYEALGVEAQMPCQTPITKGIVDEYHIIMLSSMLIRFEDDLFFLCRSPL